MKPSCNPFLVASALLSAGIAQAADYNWGSVTQNFTINRSDWGRDMPITGAANSIDNVSGDMGIYWRGSASDRTFFHFDLSVLGGATINGDVSFNAVVSASNGGVVTNSTINTANSAWAAVVNSTAPGITAIAGATNATGTFTTGQTASWVIPGTTFATYVGSPTFYGLALAGASGTNAHFSGTPTLTGSYTAGQVRALGGTDWSAVVWNGGTSTATVDSANVSSGNLIIGSGGTFALTGTGTMGGGTFSGTIANEGTLNHGSSASQTLSGTISGAGGLTKSGTGTLKLSSVNTFTGALTINSGTLEAAAATSGNASAIGNGANTINIAQGATLLFSTNGRAAGYHSGAVNLNGGTITFNTADNSFASGKTLTMDVAPGTMNGSGQWRMRDANAKVVVTAAASGSTISVADLRLTNVISGGYGFDVADGAATNDLTISSAIAGYAGGEGLTKNGAGTLSLTGSNTFTGTTTVNAGNLHVTGSLTSPVTVNGGLLELGSGGAINVTNAGNVVLGNTAGATGTMTVSGGTLTLGARDLLLGQNGTSHGIFNQTGGTANFSAGWTGIGNNGTGAANLSGGLFDSTARGVVVGVRGTSSLTVSGTADAKIAAVQIFHSDGVTGSGKTGTVNLDGGSLLTGSVSCGTTLSSSLLNLNGGTLKASGNNATFVQGLTRANVRNGGALIDTNGYNVTIGQALEHSNIGGDNDTDGGLTKDGNGTLTLTGSSTFTGDTLVNAGTLLVNGALGSSDVAVAAGAALGGTGLIGGDLNFAPGSFFDVFLSISDPLAVGGTSSFGPGFGIDNLTGITWSNIADAEYTLITGMVNTSNLDNFGLANAYDLGGGRKAYFESGSLKLVVIPEPSVILLGGMGALALLRRRRY